MRTYVVKKVADECVRNISARDDGDTWFRAKEQELGRGKFIAKAIGWKAFNRLMGGVYRREGTYILEVGRIPLVANGQIVKGETVPVILLTQAEPGIGEPVVEEPVAIEVAQ